MLLSVLFIYRRDLYVWEAFELNLCEMIVLSQSITTCVCVCECECGCLKWNSCHRRRKEETGTKSIQRMKNLVEHFEFTYIKIFLLMKESEYMYEYCLPSFTRHAVYRFLRYTRFAWLQVKLRPTLAHLVVIHTESLTLKFTVYIGFIPI